MEKETILRRIRALTSPIKPTPFEHPTKLEVLENIKVVAFDFYGTMFISGVGDIGIDEDQKQVHQQSFENALNNAGFTPGKNSGVMGLQLFQEKIKHYKQVHRSEGIEYPEPDIRSIWQSVLRELASQQHIKRPVTNKNITRFAIEYEFGVNNIWPVPGLASLLKKIHAGGRHLGIISNSQFYTPLAFEALMGTSTEDFGFDRELQTWSYKQGEKKPALSFYRSFVNQLKAKNWSPHHVLYVGNDLFKDVIPANRLGMQTGLYVGDRRSLRHTPQELSTCSHQPDIIMDDLHQILECLH